MPRVKVVQIVEDLEIGGAERVIEAIALGLDPDRFTVEVWCLVKGGKIADSLVKQGIPVRVLRMDSYFNPANVFRLARLLQESQAGIMHTHGYFASTFARLSALLVRRLIIIAHVHTAHYGLGLKNRIVERLLALFTDKIICISKSVKDFVEMQEGISASRTALIYNGVTLPSGFEKGPRPENLIKRLGFESRHKIVMTVASLQPHKGQKVLIDAIAEVRKTYASVRLLLIGAGPLKESLDEYVRRKGLSPFIAFLGEQENVYPFLSIAHLFVLPSTEREGLGLVLIEAMAMGLPVIGSDLGGIKELIVPGKNGRLCLPGDAAALAGAIKDLLGAPGLSKKMGAAGRERYEQSFRGSRMIASIGRLYSDLLCEPHG